MHTTDYFSAFIEVAGDCRATTGVEPPERAGSKTIARMQYELIAPNPYRYTSDEVLFQVYAARNGVPEAEMEAERQRFFSKGQACMRASDLPRRYGWGVRFDEKARMALCAVDSPEYARFRDDPALAHTKAMRSTAK
jgi:hypothetical protein